MSSFSEINYPLANVNAEFLTIDLILNSEAATLGVDAFALSLIKVEKQLRKLFTHLVFQSPCFSYSAIEPLRKTLNSFNSVYFEGLEKGLNALCPVPVKGLVGEQYGYLHSRIKEAQGYRNKIFHGQLTDSGLSTIDLVKLIKDLRLWCEVLAIGAQNELRYDGFARDSFQKSPIPDIANQLLVQFSNVDDYKGFIKKHMLRKSKRGDC